MSEYGQVQQLPCPDCGSPVQPEREQLCPRCGYPLMFLRKGGGQEAEARSVPRRPNEHDEGTSVRAIPQPVQPQPATYTPPAAGQVQCRVCGYLNEAARFRCERCGDELRVSRPQPVALTPIFHQPAARRSGGGWGWLIALIVLAVLALGALLITLLWRLR